MTRTEIIAHFTTNIKEFQQYAKNIAGSQDADDLFQECSLMLLQFDEPRLVSYWNDKEGLKPFFLRMLKNQYNSKTSKFDKEYRKQERFVQSHGKDIVYNEGCKDIDEPEIDRVEIAELEKYMHIIAASVTADKQIAMFENHNERMIWDLYVENGSLRKALVAIPEEHKKNFDLKSVHGIVRKFRRTIKKHLNVAA